MGRFKAGLESWLTAQARGWLEGRPSGRPPTQVGGRTGRQVKNLAVGKGRKVGLLAELEFGCRRKSEDRMKGEAEKVIAGANRRLAFR